MDKFSRGNRFSIAEHQERYKEGTAYCQDSFLKSILCIPAAKKGLRGILNALERDSFSNMNLAVIARANPDELVTNIYCNRRVSEDLRPSEPSAGVGGSAVNGRGREFRGGHL